MARYGCLPINRVAGADVSKWQARTTDPRIPIDFDTMKLMGVKFCIIRVQINGDNDPEFIRSRDGAKKAGLLWGAYIAFNYRENMLAQTQKAIDRLINDQGNLPVFVDFEKLSYSGLGPTKALERLKIAVDDLDKRLKRPCGIYTNPDAINNFIKWLPAWFVEHDLWIANYKVDSIGPEVGYQYFSDPRYPKGGFRFWQYTDRGDGIAHGCQSKQIDLDWWNGTKDELYEYVGLPTPPPPVLTMEQRLTRLENAALSHGWTLE